VGGEEAYVVAGGLDATNRPLPTVESWTARQAHSSEHPPTPPPPRQLAWGVGQDPTLYDIKIRECHDTNGNIIGIFW
jgi:hypothetical protein